MSKGPLENSVEKYLVEQVRKLGGMALKGDVKGQRFLDRVIILPGGATVFCECKRPQGGVYSRHQLETCERLEALGHRVLFIKNRAEVDMFISQLGTPAPSTQMQWLPIERADKSTDRIYDFPGMPRPIGGSEEYWCRDADGRVFLATWADDGKRAYWWGLEGESQVDPVEFMPHPLDPRWQATTEGQP